MPEPPVEPDVTPFLPAAAEPAAEDAGSPGRGSGTVQPPGPRQDGQPPEAPLRPTAVAEPADRPNSWRVPGVLAVALAAGLTALAIRPAGDPPAQPPASVDGAAAADPATSVPPRSAPSPPPADRLGSAGPMGSATPHGAPEASPLSPGRRAPPAGTGAPGRARASPAGALRGGPAPAGNSGPLGPPGEPGRLPAREAPKGAEGQTAGASPPATAEAAVTAALAHYQAGDLAAARATLAAAAADPAAAAVGARLDAIARLLGGGARWPPVGGAAALERLLELEAGLGLGRPSPLATRARAELAAGLVRKGTGLADEGRWEEAAAAFQAALGHDPGHPAALAGLDRIEQGAEALYLDGYLVEDEDPERARQLYHRALRLARPGGPLASRLSVRLGRLPVPPKPAP